MTLAGASFPHLPVSYATASAEAVIAFVAEHYGLHGALTCALLNRGFNDVYLVDTNAREQFVLRLAGRRARGPADVEAETAFLAYLEAADGRPPDLDDPNDARIQGITLAQLHQAADGYPGWEAGRHRLNLDHLLHRQVAAVLALGLNTPKALRDLLAVAARLAEAVARLDHGLTRTRCHGDCHGLNARIATTGPRAGRAVFFDFDDGGYGYLAYDLAVHLWGQVSFGRQRHAMWHAFRAGYQSVRAVTPADEAAIPVFVAIRHIWLMGEYAGRTAEWGREMLSATWLEREVKPLLAWERDNLLPGLP